MLKLINHNHEQINHGAYNTKNKDKNMKRQTILKKKKLNQLAMYI